MPAATPRAPERRLLGHQNSRDIAGRMAGGQDIARRRVRRGRHRPPVLTPIEPFATTGLEHPTSPVRTRRMRPPDLGWIRRILWPAINHFINDEGFVLAGYIAFTVFFAVFPFLIFLLALAGWLGQGEAAAEFIAISLDVLPGEVSNVMQPAIEDIRSAPHGTLITFSILLAVWFASSGLESLRHACNLAHEVSDPSSFWANRLASMAMTVASAVLILAAMTLLVGLPLADSIMAWLAEHDQIEARMSLIVRYGIGLGLLFFLTLSLYLLLPNRHLRVIDVLPGTIISATIWLAATKVYSAYLSSFGRYSIIYGSLGGVILTLFFFYVSACIFILGAQLNAAIMRERALQAERRAAG
jgi:membrane protein